MRHIIAFVKLSRLHFLTFSTLPYALGLLIAWREGGALDGPLAAWGLGIQWLVQLATAYLNDYWDLPTDRVNTRRTWLTGGSGELTTGVLSPRVGLVAGGVCLGAATVLALGVGIPSWSWLPLLLAMGAAVFYTAPPIRLAWRGLGEFGAAITAALLVPAWAYSLQTGRLSAEIVRLGLPLVPFMAGMLLGIATPDYEADRQVNKRTLAVIVGLEHVAALYAALVAAGYVLGASLYPSLGRLGLLLSLPLVAWAWWGLREPGRESRWWVMFMVARTMIPPAAILAALLAHLLRTG